MFNVALIPQFLRKLWGPVGGAEANGNSWMMSLAGQGWVLEPGKLAFHISSACVSHDVSLEASSHMIVMAIDSLLSTTTFIIARYLFARRVTGYGIGFIRTQLSYVSDFSTLESRKIVWRVGCTLVTAIALSGVWRGVQ